MARSLRRRKSRFRIGLIGFHALADMLGKAGARLLAGILPDWIKGKIQPKEQNHSGATFTAKFEKSDGLIDLSAEGYKNYLKILAYEDWPGTYFEVERSSKKIRVIIKKASYKNGVLEILRVVPEGKKEMDYKDFLRGLR